MAPGSFVLFAQNNPNAGPPAAGFACLFLPLLLVFILVAVLIVIHVLYLLACSRCLQEIAPRRRQMEPGSVWLCLIPLFGTVWHVIVMFKMIESLKSEYRARRMRGDGDYGQTATIVYLIGFAVPLVSLVGFVMHWVKVAGYTQELRSRSYAEDDEDYDDEYDDDEDYDRPRRSRSRGRDRDDYDDDRDDRRDRRPWDRD